MDIYITNVDTDTHGMPDMIASISCDVINYGDPGYVAITGYVKQNFSGPKPPGQPTSYDDRIMDEGEKRIHLNKNERVTVSFDLDTEIWPYDYGFNYHSEDPD